MTIYRVYFLIIIAFLVSGFSDVAFAAKGEVVLIRSGCSYYLVESPMGHSLLEWYGGNVPRQGDVLVGDFESYGMKTIYNLSVESETRVWVDDYYLPRTRAIEKLYKKCN